MFDSLLQSTLECFYDQHRFNKILLYIQEIAISNQTFYNPVSVRNRPTKNFSVIDPSQSSRFISTTPISKIIDQMFVESWPATPSYGDYYQQCRPIACTYSYVENSNRLYVVTLISGLFGGLTKVLTKKYSIMLSFMILLL